MRRRGRGDDPRWRDERDRNAYAMRGREVPPDPGWNERERDEVRRRDHQEWYGDRWGYGGPAYDRGWSGGGGFAGRGPDWSGRGRDRAPWEDDERDRYGLGAGWRDRPGEPEPHRGEPRPFPEDVREWGDPWAGRDRGRMPEREEPPHRGRHEYGPDFEAESWDARRRGPTSPDERDDFSRHERAWLSSNRRGGWGRGR